MRVKTRLLALKELLELTESRIEFAALVIKSMSGERGLHDSYRYDLESMSMEFEGWQVKTRARIKQVDDALEKINENKN